MLCSWHGSLLVFICNVNLKHFKPNSGLLNSKGLLLICMSADASDRPCQQGGGVGYRGQRPWQEALYIHGNFGCSKLLCTLPCNSKSWASRITLPRAHVRNFSTNGQLTSYMSDQATPSNPQTDNTNFGIRFWTHKITTIMYGNRCRKVRYKIRTYRSVPLIRPLRKCAPPPPFFFIAKVPA